MIMSPSSVHVWISAEAELKAATSSKAKSRAEEAERISAAAKLMRTADFTFFAALLQQVLLALDEAQQAQQGDTTAAAAELMRCVSVCRLHSTLPTCVATGIYGGGCALAGVFLLHCSRCCLGLIACVLMGFCCACFPGGWLASRPHSRFWVCIGLLKIQRASIGLRWSHWWTPSWS